MSVSGGTDKHKVLVGLRPVLQAPKAGDSDPCRSVDELGGITPSAVGRSQKDRSCVIPLAWGTPEWSASETTDGGHQGLGRENGELGFRGDRLVGREQGPVLEPDVGDGGDSCC